MSSVQTGQLISLLVNNVLMVMLVMAVTVAAWLRWCWLRSGSNRAIHGMRRRCRWAYISFVLAVATLLGMLTSLGVLTLRAMIAINALVTGAMAIFLLSVITLLIALGLWFVELCSDFPTTSTDRKSTNEDLFPTVPITLLPASLAPTGARRRRFQRKQRR